MKHMNVPHNRYSSPTLDSPLTDTLLLSYGKQIPCHRTKS